MKHGWGGGGNVYVSFADTHCRISIKQSFEEWIGYNLIIVDGSFDILSFLSVPWVKLCLTTIRTPAAL